MLQLRIVLYLAEVVFVSYAMCVVHKSLPLSCWKVVIGGNVSEQLLNAP